MRRAMQALLRVERRLPELWHTQVRAPLVLEDEDWCVREEAAEVEEGRAVGDVWSGTVIE